MSSAVVVPGTLQEAPSQERLQGVERNDEQTGSPARKEFYIPSLDGIRAIAFLLVFVAHAGLEGVIPGGFGVTVFFFLSGYLITTLLRGEALRRHTISIPDFYLRRVFRIMPPMYITLAIVYVVGAAGLLPQRGNLLGLVSVSAYFFNYADLLHKNVVMPSGLGVLWSLMVEEHFYLLFPCVYLLFVRHKISVRKQTAILLACCAACLVWRYVLVYHFHTTTARVYPRWTYSASEARFDAILFGCILAIRNNANFGDRSPLLERYKGLLAVVGLTTLFASLLYREPHYRETLRYTLQTVALYPIFYYVVSSANAWQASWLNWRPLRFLGWISYSMYLSHYIFLEIFRVHDGQHPVINSLVSFALALLYSWLMRILVEIPSKRWKAATERRLFARA